jgi:hypothetical protein
MEPTLGDHNKPPATRPPRRRRLRPELRHHCSARAGCAPGRRRLGRANRRTVTTRWTRQHARRRRARLCPLRAFIGARSLRTVSLGDLSDFAASLDGTPATRLRTLSAIVGGGKPIGSDSSGSCGRSRSISKGVRRPPARTVYDPTSTGVNNLAPTSKKLIDATRAVAALKKRIRT